MNTCDYLNMLGSPFESEELLMFAIETIKLETLKYIKRHQPQCCRFGQSRKP